MLPKRKPERPLSQKFPNTIPFRVVRHDADLPSDPDGPSPDWTLRQFVDGYVVPHYLEAKNRHPGTVRFYYQVVDLWEIFFPDNPSLAEIEGNQGLCHEFVERLKKRPGMRSKRMADNTVRKLCTPLQKILDLAGPRNIHGKRNRTAAALIEDVPYLERPELVRQSPQNDFTLEEIGLWLGACRFAARTRVIRRCRPEKFCRNLILFIYNTSLRIESVLLADENMIGRKHENWITIPPTVLVPKKNKKINYQIPKVIKVFKEPMNSLGRRTAREFRAENCREIRLREFAAQNSRVECLRQAASLGRGLRAPKTRRVARLASRRSPERRCGRPIRPDSDRG